MGLNFQALKSSHSFLAASLCARSLHWHCWPACSNLLRAFGSGARCRFLGGLWTGAGAASYWATAPLADFGAGSLHCWGGAAPLRGVIDN